MKYEIYIRKVEEKDLSRECPYPDYDEETFLMHLASLVEDIGSNEHVIEASENNNIITVHSLLQEEKLLEKLKYLFQREFCFIKFKKIIEIK